MSEQPEEPGEFRWIHLCEVCGRREILEPSTAYFKGWDYPPRQGAWRVVSPRTCPDCPTTATLWWRVTMEGATEEELTERERETLRRILGEPESVIPAPQEQWGDDE